VTTAGIFAGRLRFWLFLWLRYLAWRHRGVGAAVAFAKIWQANRQHPLIASGAMLYRNLSAYRANDIILYRILAAMTRRGLHFRPRLLVSGADLLSSVAANGRAGVIVSVHVPQDAAINPVLEGLGLAWTLLAARLSVTKKAKLYGLQGDLDVTLRSQDSLLELRRKWRGGSWILADVDDPDWKTMGDQMPIEISPSLFVLAGKLKAPLFYCYTKASEEGEVELTFAASTLDTATASGEALAEDFITWLRDRMGDRRPWQIGKWTPSQK
jgi:hypothetical protein